MAPERGGVTLSSEDSPALWTRRDHDGRTRHDTQTPSGGSAYVAWAGVGLAPGEGREGQGRLRGPVSLCDGLGVAAHADRCSVTRRHHMMKLSDLG